MVLTLYFVLFNECRMEDKTFLCLCSPIISSPCHVFHFNIYCRMVCPPCSSYLNCIVILSNLHPFICFTWSNKLWLYISKWPSNLSVFANTAFQRYLVQTLAGAPSVLFENFCSATQSLQANARIMS